MELKYYSERRNLFMRIISYFTTAEITQMYFMTRNGSNICRKKIAIGTHATPRGSYKMHGRLTL